MRDFDHYLNSKRFTEAGDPGMPIPGSAVNPKKISDGNHDALVADVASEEDPGIMLKKFLRAHDSNLFHTKSRIDALLGQLNDAVKAVQDKNYQSQAPTYLGQYGKMDKYKPVGLPSQSNRLTALRQAWQDRRQDTFQPTPVEAPNLDPMSGEGK